MCFIPPSSSFSFFFLNSFVFLFLFKKYFSWRMCFSPFFSFFFPFFFSSFCFFFLFVLVKFFTSFFLSRRIFLILLSFSVPIFFSFSFFLFFLWSSFFFFFLSSWRMWSSQWLFLQPFFYLKKIRKQHGEGNFRKNSQKITTFWGIFFWNCKKIQRIWADF